MTEVSETRRTKKKLFGADLKPPSAPQTESLNEKTFKQAVLWPLLAGMKRGGDNQTSLLQMDSSEQSFEILMV